MSFLLRKIQQWKESAWLLGICENGFDDLKAGRIRWIGNGPYEKKKWFADPFILDNDDHRIHLLVEEFDYRVHRGRIARLTIDRNLWAVTDCTILLDLETHLSFPMIWRQDDTVYVCPENCRSGGWDLYRYDPEAGKLLPVRRLMDKPLTDAVLYEHDGHYYILSTRMPKPNGRVLTVYQSKEATGEYRKHQEIEFEDNVARNAGAPFHYGDRIIRPAQESNTNYGNALVFQQMEEKDGLFSFTELCRVYSTNRKYRFGTHTYNQHPEGCAVIDVKGFRHPFMGRLLLVFSKMMVALHLKKQFHFE